MTSSISLLSGVVGVVAVGALYGLHLLRSQPRQLSVATIQFWQQAAPARQASILRSRRFIHRKTFLLLASIILLIAAALSAGRWHGASDQAHVIVIDSGDETLALSDGGRTVLKNETLLAAADLDSQPTAPSLVTAGSVPIVQNDADDKSAAIIRARLKDIQADRGDSDSAAALTLAGQMQQRRGGAIDWYTDQPAVPQGIPEATRRRVVIHPVRAPVDGLAINSVSFEPDDATAQRGTMLVEVSGRSTQPSRLTLITEGGGPRAAAFSAVEPDKNLTLRFTNLTADGRSTTVSLQDAPGPMSARRVQFRLPKRTPIRFSGIGPASSALAAALSSIGSVAHDPAGGSTTSGDAVISVSTDQPARAEEAAAAICIVDDGPVIGNGERLPIHPGDAPLMAGLQLEGAMATNIRRILQPGETLLEVAGQPVATFLKRDTQRTLYLSRALVADDADLPHHAAFVVMLARACQALAGWSEGSVVESRLRAAQDPLWPGDPTRPVTPVPSRPVLSEAPATAMNTVPVSRSHSSPSAVELLLALGLTGLMVEGFLWARGKIA